MLPYSFILSEKSSVIGDLCLLYTMLQNVECWKMLIQEHFKNLECQCNLIT